MTERDAGRASVPHSSEPAAEEQPRDAGDRPENPVGPVQPEGEKGGPKGPEPTRFGDWEKDGRCFDF
jgi:hypothetical protein